MLPFFYCGALVDTSKLLLFLVIIVLAVQRISYILINDEGPAGIVVRFKWLLGIDKGVIMPRPFPLSMLGKLFSCFYCLSVWVSFFGLLAGMFAGWVPINNIPEFGLYWFGIAGGVFLVEWVLVG